MTSAKHAHKRIMRWTWISLLDLARSYQSSDVLAAAADLEIFDILGDQQLAADELARKSRCDVRGITVLLDALAALRLLRKDGRCYSVPANLVKFLRIGNPLSVIAMAQHQANCSRNWVQLAKVIKTGRPAERTPSIRGESRDREAFITAMHNTYAAQADDIMRPLQGLSIKHILDVGGGSGTWTIALLRRFAGATATLVDLPDAIPMARHRLCEEGLGNRVTLFAADFEKDELPRGADFAWLSAIVHQNSRAQNRRLFGRIFRVLTPGGRIAIRDVVMNESRTSPKFGTLFALNMLVETRGGGTFTLKELRADLNAAGFGGVSLLRRDEGMNSVLVAAKPRKPS